MTISDVQFDGNKYRVFDEGSQEVNSFWDSEGELAGFGKNYLVFERNEQYRFVRVESGEEIACHWLNNIGRFKHANGELAVFERDAKVFTHLVGCSGVSEVSSRWV